MNKNFQLTGVLLLYGQHLGLNHLVLLNNTFKLVKLDNMIDYPTSNSDPLDGKLHLHSWHGRERFSKHSFMDGIYDRVSLPIENFNQINSYCLKIALEAKRTNSSMLNRMFRFRVESKKT